MRAERHQICGILNIIADELRADTSMQNVITGIRIEFPNLSYCDLSYILFEIIGMLETIEKEAEQNALGALRY